VPLHAQKKALVFALERFHHAVRRSTDGAQAAAQPVHGLVVKGVAPEAGRLQGPRQARPRLERDAVRERRAAVGLGVLQRAAERGQVLVEATALSHVHELHAAADAQDRQPARPCGAVERELEHVALRFDVLELSVRLLAVVSGVDVAAAREEHAANPVQVAFGQLGSQVADHKGQATRLHHRLGVVLAGHAAGAAQRHVVKEGAGGKQDAGARIRHP
jgi:hypothetical protein